MPVGGADSMGIHRNVVALPTDSVGPADPASGGLGGAKG